MEWNLLSEDLRQNLVACVIQNLCKHTHSNFLFVEARTKTDIYIYIYIYKERETDRQTDREREFKFATQFYILLQSSRLVDITSTT